MCGATSYRPVIARDESGSMRRTGLYQCSRCSVVFADPKAWRDGGADELDVQPQLTRSQRVMTTQDRSVTQGPPNPDPHPTVPAG